MAGEWREKMLGELTENFDGIRVPVKGADRHTGPYPYYGASGIVDYIDNYLFDGEYLLIAEDGENLRTRNTPIAFLARGKFWVNNHAHIVRGNDEADTCFLMYALSATDISGYLTGSTMPKLTQGNMNRIPIIVPPLPEQRAIAHILGTLDDKIELNRRMNETLEAMARAIFKSWFVDATENRIPKGWKVAPIGDCVSVFGGSTPSTDDPAFWDGEIHFTTPKDLASLTAPVLLETERRITKAGLARISSGLLPRGTVLLSSRAPIGYLAISEIPVAVNQGFIAMVCDRILPNHYVLHWARQNMDVIVGNANGTTFLEISKRNFRPIPVIVPPPDVLEAFVGRIEPLYTRIVSNLRESRTLTAIRDALLPKLLSGEIRVQEQRGVLC
jgi:type I restriction enzyme S subunit